MKLSKKSKKWIFKETGPIYYEKFVGLNNLGQNIRNRTEKLSKIWQDKKGLVSTFANFLTVTVKVDFLKRRTCTRLRPHSKLLGNSWGFVLFYLWQIGPVLKIAEFQNIMTRIIAIEGLRNREAILDRM